MRTAPIRVCIVGVGLIGGSLGMALRRARKRGRRVFHVIGLGRKASSLRNAKRRGAVDSFSTNASATLPNADIVVFCVPVHQIVPAVEQNLRNFKLGAVLTDVGSVKGSIVKGWTGIRKRRPDLKFVGAHPIAGSEKTGVENARADLFKNATCVLTKDHASFQALDRVRSMWNTTGAHCFLLSAAEHDRWLALTSHLPHLLAFALFSHVDSASKISPILRSLVAGSFRDMTRIAGANASLWTGIIANNRTEIKRAATHFLNRLKFFSNAPSRSLEKILTELTRSKSRW